MYSVRRRLMVLMLTLGIMLSLSLFFHFFYNTPYSLELTLLGFVADLILMYLIVREVFVSVLNPIKKFNQNMLLVSEGDLSGISMYGKVVEIHELQNSLVQIALRENQISEMIVAISTNNSEHQFSFKSKNDFLGRNLMDLKSKMNSIKQEEKKRNWLNEGLARFGELLILDTLDLNLFCSKVLSPLVKHLGGNLGMFYICQGKDNCQELLCAAGYGVETNATTEANFKICQGMVGQVLNSKKIQVISGLPNNFIEINSGLGQSRPDTITLVPLIYNEVVIAVIEIATFRPLEGYQIEFLEKLSVSMAMAVSSLTLRIETQRLLDESNAQRSELQEKDKTLRRNVEEMKRTQLEMINIENKTNAIVEGSIESIVAFNESGEIEFFNKIAEEIWNIKRERVLGENISQFLPIAISGKSEDCQVFLKAGSGLKEFQGKNELIIKNSNQEEVSILCSISQTMIGEKKFFTAYIQNITVDIF